MYDWNDEADAERFVLTYADLILRLCLSHGLSRADAQDICQELFLKLLAAQRTFTSEEHEKAWFIRVTLNACRDLLRRFRRAPTVPLEALGDQPAPLPPDHREVLEAVQALPEKYRNVVYLHYYEGYTAPEIGRLLGKNVNTVYTLLTRSKELLRQKLGGDGDGT